MATVVRLFLSHYVTKKIAKQTYTNNNKLILFCFTDCI